MSIGPEHSHPAVPQLVVKNGPLAGTIIDVDGRVTIGRHPQNTLRLLDEQISRFHAAVERSGDDYLVTDLGSSTGTIVDGRRLEAPAQLKNQSRVMMGRTVLQFTFDAPQFNDDSVTLTDSPALFTNDDPRLTILPAGLLDSLHGLPRVTRSDLLHANEQLQAVLTINSIISNELDIEQLMQKILDALFRAFPAHRAVIMTQAEKTGELEIRAARTRTGEWAPENVRVSSSIVQRSFRQRVGVLTQDAVDDDRFDARMSIVDQNIRSAICAPMLHHDEVMGIIYLDALGITNAFTEVHLRLLTGIAGPAGGAVRTAMLVRRLRHTASDTVYRLAIAAEYRDDDTGFHIHRMSDYAEAIARARGMAPEYCVLVKMASPMHDVGKIGVPDAILKKPGRLTKEEFEIMKEHTVKGGAILTGSETELLQMAETIAMAHHEKFDGRGYPRGLAGDRIPLVGRIVAVADVFDALTNKRCYKDAMPMEKAFGIINEDAGTHFDPEVVEAFNGVQDQIVAIREHYRVLEDMATADLVPANPTAAAE